MSNVLEETERGLMVGPEPYLATCGRCGARLPMPEMPMKMQVFIGLLKSAVSEHAVCPVSKLFHGPPEMYRVSDREAFTFEEMATILEGGSEVAP